MNVNLYHQSKLTPIYHTYHNILHFLDVFFVQMFMGQTLHICHLKLFYPLLRLVLLLSRFLYSNVSLSSIQVQDLVLDQVSYKYKFLDHFQKSKSTLFKTFRYYVDQQLLMMDLRPVLNEYSFLSDYLDNKLFHFTQ